MSRHDLDKLIEQLDNAQQIAIEDRKPTAIIQATLAQAKLLGLDSGVTEDEEVQPVKVVIQVEDARNPDRQLIN